MGLWMPPSDARTTPAKSARGPRAGRTSNFYCLVARRSGSSNCLADRCPKHLLYRCSTKTDVRSEMKGPANLRGPSRGIANATLDEACWKPSDCLRLVLRDTLDFGSSYGEVVGFSLIVGGLTGQYVFDSKRIFLPRQQWTTGKLSISHVMPAARLVWPF
jgi:hypothetical protein